MADPIDVVARLILSGEDQTKAALTSAAAGMRGLAAATDTAAAASQAAADKEKTFWQMKSAAASQAKKSLGELALAISKNKDGIDELTLSAKADKDAFDQLVKAQTSASAAIAGTTEKVATFWTMQQDAQLKAKNALGQYALAVKSNAGDIAALAANYATLRGQSEAFDATLQKINASFKQGTDLASTFGAAMTAAGAEAKAALDEVAGELYNEGVASDEALAKARALELQYAAMAEARAAATELVTPSSAAKIGPGYSNTAGAAIGASVEGAGAAEAEAASLKTTAVEADAYSQALSRAAVAQRAVINAIGQGIPVTEAQTFELESATIALRKFEIAQARVTAFINADTIAARENALAEAERNGALQSTGLGVRTAIQGFNGYNASMLITRGNVLLLAAAIGVESAKAFADYQQGLANLRGNTGMTAKQINTISGEITDLGSRGPISLSDLTTAFRHASDESFHNAAAMQIVTAAWEGAYATGGKVADITNTLAREMHNFNEGPGQAQTVMGTLLVGAQQGNQTLDQLVQSLSKVGPLAAAIHMPLNDLVALVSEFTKATGNPSLSQTWADNMLIHIVNPTKIALTVMAELKQATGVDLQQAFQQFAAGQISFYNVMEKVKQATGDNAGEVMALFGGIRGGTGALQFLSHGMGDYNTILGKTKDGTKQLNEQLRQQQGTISNDLLTSWDAAKVHAINLASAINDIAKAINRVQSQGQKHNASTGTALAGSAAGDLKGYLDLMLPFSLLGDLFSSSGPPPKASGQQTTASSLIAQQDSVQKSIDKLKTLETQRGLDAKQIAQMFNDIEREAALRAKVADLTDKQAEAYRRLQGARSQEEQFGRRQGTSPPPTVPIPQTGTYYQAQFATDSKAEQAAAYKLAGDELNQGTLSAKAWAKELEADRASLKTHAETVAKETALYDKAQSALNAADKASKKAAEPYDAQTNAQTQLTNATRAAANEFWGVGGTILPATATHILDLNDKLAKFQAAMALLAAKSDAMTAAQTALQAATTASYNDFGTYHQILPQHMAELVAATQKVDAFQNAVGKAAIAIQNQQWEKFGPQELAQSGAITLLQQQATIAGNQLGITSEQKAVIDAGYALQEAEHQVQLDQLKLLEVIADPKHTKQQVAEARAAVTADQGAVTVAGSNLSAAEVAASIAKQQTHYALMEQTAQNSIDQLKHQSTMIGLSLTLTANEKAVEQAHLQVAMDQKQIAIDQLKLTADLLGHATPDKIAADRAAVSNDIAKMQEDQAAQHNAQVTEKASYYTDEWAKKISAATTRYQNDQAELSQKIYDLKHNIADNLPPLSVLQSQTTAAAQALGDLTYAAKKAAAPPSGKPITFPFDPNGPSLLGSTVDSTHFGTVGHGGLFNLPRGVGQIDETAIQAKYAAREQAEQNIIDNLQHKAVLESQDLSLTADQRKIDQDILQIKEDRKQTQIDLAKLEALQASGTATPEQIAAAKEQVTKDRNKTTEDTGQLGVDKNTQSLNQLSTYLSQFNTTQQNLDSLAQAQLAITTDQGNIQVQKIQAVVTAIDDQTNKIQAASALATAQASAQTTLVTDQTGIMAATFKVMQDAITAQRTIDADLRNGDTAKAALDRQVAAAQQAVDRDAVAVARAQYQRDVEIGQEQIQIAKDGVQLAQDKASADAAAANIQATILTDQLNLDQAKLTLLQDQLALTNDTNQILNQANVANGLQSWGPKIDADFAKVGTDMDAVRTATWQLASDQSAANKIAGNWATTIANDNQKTAIDQALLAATQGNWAQAIAILQQQSQVDSQGLSTAQDSLSALQDLRQTAVQALQVQAETLQRGNITLDFQKNMIDANASLTSNEKDYYKTQLSIQEDQLVIQEDQLKLQEVIAQGGDQSSLMQAQNQILTDSLKLQLDQYTLQQQTLKATQDANSIAALEQVIATLRALLYGKNTSGRAPAFTGATTAAQFNAIARQATVSPRH